MKTGIIVHSLTNNTLSVGQRLLDTLIAQGCEACLERVQALDDNAKPPKHIRLAEAPDLHAYDQVIIGAPVHGFSLSPAMDAYLSQLTELSGKRIFCFVTEHFPKPWMGGSRAVRQMARHIARLGGIVTKTAVVNWSSKAREEQIDRLAEDFAKATAEASK